MFEKCNSSNRKLKKWLLLSARLTAKFELVFVLKVQSSKLYANKYMIASTKTANTEIFTFIAVLVFQLLSRKVLFINRKDNKNC